MPNLKTSYYLGTTDKALVLQALYNNAKPEPADYNKRMCGNSGKLTAEEATTIIEGNPSLKFDHVYGRAIRADISGTTTNLTDYVHANGDVITKIRADLYAMKTDADLKAQATNAVPSSEKTATEEPAPKAAKIEKRGAAKILALGSGKGDGMARGA